MNLNYGSNSDNDPFDFENDDHRMDFSLFILYSNGLIEKNITDLLKHYPHEKRIIWYAERYVYDFQARFKCRNYMTIYVPASELELLKKEPERVSGIRLRDKEDSIYNRRVILTFEEKDEKETLPPAPISPDELDDRRLFTIERRGIH